MTRSFLIGGTIFLMLVASGLSRAETKEVISDGALGSLPRNSMVALAVSLARGAGSIKVELVLTSDDQVVVLGDTVLNSLTDVSDRYPKRAREDGNYYALDFTLAEIQTLSLALTEKLTVTNEAPPYPPPRIGILSLAETLGMIRALEKSLERRVGLVAEIKKSWFHLGEGKDVSSAVIGVLAQYGYTTPENDVFLASFDAEELQKIHTTLLPAAGVNIQLLQLVENNNGTETMRLERGRLVPYNYDWMFTKFGLKVVSAYASAMGLPAREIIDDSGGLNHAHYLEDAHLLGLQLFVHGFDSLTDPLPGYAESVEALLEHYLFFAGLDGLFTSQGERARTYLANRLPETTETVSSQQQLIDRLIENGGAGRDVKNTPASQ